MHGELVKHGIRNKQKIIGELFVILFTLYSIYTLLTSQQLCREAIAMAEQRRWQGIYNNSGGYLCVTAGASQYSRKNLKVL